jgi:hypothetical protein
VNAGVAALILVGVDSNLSLSHLLRSVLAFLFSPAFQACGLRPAKTKKPFLLRKKGFRLSGWQDSNLLLLYLIIN